MNQPLNTWISRSLHVLFWICFTIVISFPLCVGPASDIPGNGFIFYMVAAAASYLVVCYGSAYYVERAPTFTQWGMIMLGLMWALFSFGVAWLSTNPDVM